VCPLSALRHNGVIVVPQFWQAITTVVFACSMLKAATSMGDGASEGWSF
jgi:hypothetical protein